jgi:hypothetical protein
MRRVTIQPNNNNNNNNNKDGQAQLQSYLANPLRWVELFVHDLGVHDLHVVAVERRLCCIDKGGAGWLAAIQATVPPTW